MAWIGVLQTLKLVEFTFPASPNAWGSNIVLHKCRHFHASQRVQAPDSDFKGARSPAPHTLHVSGARFGLAQATNREAGEREQHEKGTHWVLQRVKRAMAAMTPFCSAFTHPRPPDTTLLRHSRKRRFGRLHGLVHCQWTRSIV